MPFAPDLVTCDVSFISVRTALPPALALARPGWEALVLVKPQFEAGREEVGKGGVVETRRCTGASLHEVAEAALALACRDCRRRRLGPARPEGKPGVLPAPRPPRDPSLPDELDDWIEDAVS